jgi:hypothetical protein
VNSNSRISKHCFRTGGGDDQLFVCNVSASITNATLVTRLTGVLNRVSERCNNTKLETLFRVITLDVHQSSTGEGHLVDFQVRQASVEVDRPVDKSVRPVEQFALMQGHECLDNGFAQRLIWSASAVG